ncbi:MAG: right-handed parallel beta-helix repeat-containing protein [Candidatus Hydrogenedens sp.]|jgi:hypothetical protein|nr:right-handed parallel beta-helix repeat-containing protein [Candidatus Hydrogenedens sp.]
MRIFSFMFCLAVALACVSGFAEDELKRLYVSPEGNDAWSGTLEQPDPAGGDGPLATVAGARDALRQWRAVTDGHDKIPVEVLLRGGKYAITSPIVFEPEDSGTRHAPVVYKAYPDEVPVLFGGRRIDSWEIREDRWVASVPEAQGDDFAVGAFWVNGERLDAARFPKAAHTAGDYPAESDFFYTDGAVLIEDAKEGEEKKSSTRLRFHQGDILDWTGLDEAVFVVFHSWATSLHRVKAVDFEKRILEFTGAARWPFTRWLDRQWFFVDHLLDALDTPGEWCLERKAGLLHYIPRAGETPDTVEAVIPLTRKFLSLTGVPEKQAFVSHLHFEGIHMRYGDWPIGKEGHSDGQAETSVGAAIETRGARHCVFRDCEVSHVGSYGIWLRLGTQNTVVERCAFTDLGAGGVRIGEGHDAELVPCLTEHNTLDNCLLHDGGRIYRSAVGVWIGRSSHNTISRNEICDFRYSGVSVGWSWGYAPTSAHHNKIVGNHIHNLGKGQLSDMGGIYTLGVSPGTELCNNYIHDILSNGNISGGWGLYTDEGSTYILLRDNVICNTRTGGFHQHYGRENQVVNNIFAFSQRDQLIRSREEEHVSFFFEKNIVYFKEGGLLGSTWKNGNYVLNDNCYWDASGREIRFKDQSFAEWQKGGQDKDSVIADPLFVDVEGRDFTLAEDSPALALGFEPIDLSLSGLYGDAEWVGRAKSLKRIYEHDIE